MTPTIARGNEQTVAWLRELHTEARAWHERQEQTVSLTARTAAYIDLTFAFGLARLGEGNEAESLLTQAETALVGTNDSAHTVLYQAFAFRVHQALNGRPLTDPLSGELLGIIEQMERLPRYVVDRLRKDSRILEPDQNLNPYRGWGARIDSLERELVELTDLTSREAFVTRLEELLTRYGRRKNGEDNRTRIVCAGLTYAALAGQECTERLLEQARQLWQHLASIEGTNGLDEQARLLKRIIRATVQYSLREPFLEWLQVCEHWLASLQDPWWAASLLEECIQGLIQLNLPDEADQFLFRVSQRLLGGRTVQEWLDEPGNGVADSQSPPSWQVEQRARLGMFRDQVRSLQSLLPVSGGWYAFGWNSLADPVLARVQEILFADRLLAKERLLLASASLSAVSRATRNVAAPFIASLFDRLTGIRDTYTTCSHYGLDQLVFVEAVVFAAVEAGSRT